MIVDGRHELTPQVPRSQYFSPSYLSPGRFVSYGHQLREVLTTAPDGVLEVGIGNGFVAYALKQAGLAITTLDFDPTLEPDIVASVTGLPLEDDSFDVVACFEVLEHIPWESVPLALAEIHRVCRRYALISLPDARPVFSIHIPKVLRQRVFNWPFWRPKCHEFNGEHYWEINKKGYPLQDILDCMTHAGFQIVHTFRRFGSAHRFFRLEK